METLSNILASFDIFQVIINSFPQIFTPIVHAFRDMFILVTDIAGKQFESHPGLISGTILFLFVYLLATGFSKLRKSVISARHGAPKPMR
jgi:hypothetical protein